MDPNISDLYAGLAGARLALDSFDFGKGVTLRKTYAHIMAPYLAAFAPARAGKPHPAPWKAVSGGLGFDVQAELFIPSDFSLPNWFDRVNTAWWLVALMRLEATPLLIVPVIASQSFAEIPASAEEPEFWPIEMRRPSLIPTPDPAESISENHLQWVRQYWIRGGQLMNQSSDFNLAFQVADQCIWSPSPSLGLLSLWGALERLFAPFYSELSFRVSATIASYLEPPGQARLECYRNTKRIYDSRSKAAHGAPVNELDPFIKTYALLKRALMKIIEDNHVPTHEELEASLFRGTAVCPELTQ